MISSKIYFSIQIFLVIIITFLTERILNLWLGHVPDYTVIFLNLVLIQSLIRSLHMPIDMLFSGKGDIKYYELAEGVILFLPVPISYILLKMGFPYYSAFISLIVVEVLHIFAITIICKKICGLPLANYYKKVIAPCTFCFIIYISMFVFNNYIYSSLAISIVNIVISLIITMSIMYLLGLDRNERYMLMSIVKRKNIK